MNYSYGLQSEHIFDKFIGEIFEAKSYSCVRHPKNPDYFFGNYLLLKQGSYTKEALESDFSSLIGSKEIYSHKAFQWLKGQIEINLEPFLKDDYKYVLTKVLSCNELSFKPTTKKNSHIEIIELTNEKHWCDWINIELELREDDQPLEQFKRYLNGKKQMYRAMIDANKGKWFGAYINSTLVGSVGFFHDDKLGRFQSVITHPSHRGQNICKTLVTHACKYALTKTDRLIMLADSNYHAAKIYESLGFKCIEEISSLCWWKKD